MTKKVTQKIKRKSVAVWVWGYARCDELILKKKKKFQPAEKSSLRAVSSALIASHPPPLTPSRSERGRREKGLRVWIREVLEEGGARKNTTMNGYRWRKGGRHLIDRFDRSYVFSFHLNTGRLKHVQIQTQSTRPQQNRSKCGHMRRD